MKYFKHPDTSVYRLNETNGVVDAIEPNTLYPANTGSLTLRKFNSVLKSLPTGVEPAILADWLYMVDKLNAYMRK